MTAWESGKPVNSLPACKSLFSPRCQNHQLLDGALPSSFWNNLSRALGSPAKQAVGRWLCGPPLPISSQSPLSSHKAGLLRCQMGDTNSPVAPPVLSEHLSVSQSSSRTHILLFTIAQSAGQSRQMWASTEFEGKARRSHSEKTQSQLEEVGPKSKCQSVIQRLDHSLDSS